MRPRPRPVQPLAPGPHPAEYAALFPKQPGVHRWLYWRAYRVSAATATAIGHGERVPPSLLTADYTACIDCNAFFPDHQDEPCTGDGSWQDD